MSLRTFFFSMFLLAAIFAPFLEIYTPPEVAAAVQFDPSGNLRTKTTLSPRSPTAFAVLIINAVLGLIGIISITLFIMGGGMYLFAGGNEDKIAQARKLLRAALFGIAIVVLSLAVSYFVFTQLYDIFFV